jgi:hypothetical protein
LGWSCQKPEERRGVERDEAAIAPVDPRRLAPDKKRRSPPRNPTGLDEGAIHLAASKTAALMPQAGGRVQITATFAPTVEEAEWLTAKAIREGKSVRGLIAELVRAAAVDEA